MSDVEFGYQAPRLVADNLWELRGEWRNKLGRRMTVIRLRDGRLVIHNAFRLKGQDLDWLNSLGKTSFIVAPNTFHCSDAGWMNRQFPMAELFVPQSKMQEFSSKGLLPKNVNSEFPAALAAELPCFPMCGTRMDEAAFLHVPSKTLILCDLAFNMNDVFSGFEKWIMRWNKVGGRFGPSRLTKLIFAKDTRALLASYQELLSKDFDRVIVNHGEVLETQGQAKLQASVAEIFG